MGEQRPAILTNEVEDDLLDRPPAGSLSICTRRMTSPPRTQMLSRCSAQGLARQSSGQHFARNGLKHSTIRSPYGMSRFSYAQLPGH